MSKPRHYWYGNIRRMIMNSSEIMKEKSFQAYMFTRAFEDAIEETKALPNGELRIKAVNDVLIRKTKTMEGVALEIHYDYRTVQNWINSFVNLVGKKAGY